MHIKIFKEISETYPDNITPRYGGPIEIVRKDSYKGKKFNSYLSIEDIILKVAKKTKQSINTIRNEYYNKVLEKYTQIINDNTHNYILEQVMMYVLFKGENEKAEDYMKARVDGGVHQVNTKNNKFHLTFSFCKERYDKFCIDEIERYKNEGWNMLHFKNHREGEVDLYNNMLKIKNFKIQIYSPNGAITEGNVTCQSIDIKSFKKHLKKSSPFYYYPMAFPEEPKITKNYSIDIPLNK